MSEVKVRLLIKEPVLDGMDVHYMNIYHDLLINVAEEIIREMSGDIEIRYQVVGASVDESEKYLNLHLSASIYIRSQKEGFVGVQKLYRVYPYPAEKLPDELRIERFKSELEVYGSVVEE